jgi:hypothetical protein
MGRGEGPLSTHLRRRPTPHNNRCRLYADDPVDEDDDNYGAAILCTEFADLPIPMPGSVQVITDGKGVPLAIRLDDEGKWVRKVDVPQDWLGICQFNRDLETEDGEWDNGADGRR